MYALVGRVEVDVVGFAGFELLAGDRVVDPEFDFAPRRRLREARIFGVLLGIGLVDRAEADRVVLDPVTHHFRAYSHRSPSVRPSPYPQPQLERGGGAGADRAFCGTATACANVSQNASESSGLTSPRF